MVKIDFIVKTYGKNENFNSGGHDLNAIEFYNTGEDKIQVNGRSIDAGKSWSIFALQGEVICTRFEVRVLESSANKSYVVTRKIYV